MATKNEIDNRCKLRIVRQIAAGGMGAVSEAIQEGAGGFEKRVAIKEILPNTSQDKAFVEMFVGEAKLVADLVHENIVQIYQLNEIDSRHYIVMEYVNGLALADFIDLHRNHDGGGNHRAIPVELAVFIASRIARGLAYAHSRTDCFGKPLHIVHRDVCPKNIMITTEGLPKLGDFGIASAANMQMDQQSSQAVGKFSYMAPEQAAAENTDFRADIYSLGLVLFELLSLTRSRLKWNSNLMIAAINGWVDWELLPKKLPKKLIAILKTMLSESPEKRYQSTDELAHDLELFIYGKGYGPTVVTLEKYMRNLAPELYDFQIASSDRQANIRSRSEDTTAVSPSPNADTRIV